MIATKLTSKYQATIPLEIRKKLSLGKGDLLVFEIKNKSVVVKKATGADAKYLSSIQKTLNEWESENDCESYDEL